VRLAWLVLAAFLSGCAGNHIPSGGEDTARRIVSLVPAATEMLFALGAGDRVVGVTDFDSYPPPVVDIPKVGALLDPNVERIFELQPDLVVTYRTQSTLTARLESAGIRSFSFVTGSIGDMLSTIETLGGVIGEPETARRVAAEIEASLELTRAQGSSRASGGRPKVLLAHSRDAGVIGSFYTEGRPSYLNELVEIAGGENLFADVGMTSFQPSLEQVLERSPEVIIELLPASGGAPGSIRRRLEDWARLESVPAVRNDRVYVLADDYLLLVGPRIHLVAARLAGVIHPPADTSRE